MKINEHTIIKGSQIYLVPYEEYHVPKYHEWMRNEELQFLTGSEPLTLEEEYKMARSWRADSDKCTFIILDKEVYEKTADEVDAMIGDTNIFLKNNDSREVAEIEIMIAESSARRKGNGKQAVLFMLRYGAENLNVKVYQAKIAMVNTVSASLFLKLGFEKISESNIFEEVTLQKEVNDSWLNWLRLNTQDYLIEEKK